MAKVEYWRWRYLDSATGHIRRTTYVMTAKEAAKYPGAERIVGTLLVSEVVHPDFVDTTPRVRSLTPK